jgi:hypothetical protein
LDSGHGRVQDRVASDWAISRRKRVCSARTQRVNKKQNTNWLTPIGADDYVFIIKGWYPASFSWDIASLHERQSQLKKLKIVFEIRPGQKGGEHSEVLFGQLPLPLFSDSDYVTKEFSPYFVQFAPVPVRTVVLDSDGRCQPWGKDVVPVPSPQAFYSKPQDVPPAIHMAIIGGRFCMSATIVAKHNYYFRKMALAPLNHNPPLPIPKTPDFTSLFAKKAKSSEFDVEKAIYQFVMAALQNYTKQHSDKLTALLLDCDPKYSYVIVALKQSPVRDLENIDIQDFELEQFAILESSQLYGSKEFLPRRKLGEVLERVISSISNSPLVASITGTPALHIGYAYHDESLRWITAVKPTKSKLPT